MFPSGGGIPGPVRSGVVLGGRITPCRRAPGRTGGARTKRRGSRGCSSGCGCRTRVSFVKGLDGDRPQGRVVARPAEEHDSARVGRDRGAEEVPVPERPGEAAGGVPRDLRLKAGHPALGDEGPARCEAAPAPLVERGAEQCGARPLRVGRVADDDVETFGRLHDEPGAVGDDDLDPGVVERPRGVVRQVLPAGLDDPASTSTCTTRSTSRWRTTSRSIPPSPPPTMSTRRADPPCAKRGTWASISW